MFCGWISNDSWKALPQKLAYNQEICYLFSLLSVDFYLWIIREIWFIIKTKQIVDAIIESQTDVILNSNN